MGNKMTEQKSKIVEQGNKPAELATQPKQMQTADRETMRKWYRLIEDGVPQDKVLDSLRNEATSSTAPEEYLKAWNSCSKLNVVDTKGLTLAECLALKMYTADEHKFYRRFNEDCRNQKWGNYVIFTSLLHSAICKRRREHDETTVTRRVNCDTKVKKDNNIFMPAFTSAAANPKEMFGRNEITFKTTRLGSIADLSIYPGEEELLITPFQCFNVEQSSSRPVFRTSIEMTCPFLASPLVRGSLLGAIVGNCIGAPYEFENPMTVKMLLQNLQKLENNASNRGKSRYTSDAAMTLALADSITREECLNMEDIRTSFVQTPVNDPGRGYSRRLTQVLTELRGQTKDDDHSAPAKRLFDGQGSKGNGGAMRIAPLAIYYFFERENQFNDYVKSVTSMTHNHIIAIHGAILQATAVQHALVSSFYGGRCEEFCEVYIEELIKRMKSIEFLTRPFCQKLEKIKTYLGTSPTEAKIREELGTGITADESVPTAIYCFLRGMKPIPGIPDDRTEFERTIIYAISLGGDTDTIASMAGAIAGAYYGQDAVTQRWRDLCETKAIDDAKRYANKMIVQLFWDGKE